MKFKNLTMLILLNLLNQYNPWSIFLLYSPHFYLIIPRCLINFLLLLVIKISGIGMFLPLLLSSLLRLFSAFQCSLLPQQMA